MKRTVLTLLFASFACSAAFANVIYYNTNGTVFNCSGGNVTGCGTEQIVVGGTIQLTYVPTVANVTVDSVSPTSFANFGYLQSACVANSDCSPQTLPGDLALALTINQDQPDPTTGGLIPGGAIAGGLAGGSSSSSIFWGANGFVVYTGATSIVTYSIANTMFSLVPPASCKGSGSCGQTTIQGQITDPAPPNSTVPEPAVSLLLAAGLVTIGASRVKRSK